ncbi:MAG: hypothetical protein AB7T63_08345 [Planctomycetota bacterium]
MTRRSRHPAKTLLLLLAFGAVAWAVYRYWPALNDQIRGEEQRPDPALVEGLRGNIEAMLEGEACSLGLQDVAWRRNEGRFVVRLDADPACGQGPAKDLCARVARLVAAQGGGYPASVFAYNGAGEQFAQYIE